MIREDLHVLLPTTSPTSLLTVTPVRQVCFQLLDHTTEFPISTLVLIKISSFSFTEMRYFMT